MNKYSRSTLVSYLFLVIIISLLIFSCNERVQINRLESLANAQFGDLYIPNQVTPEQINVVVDMSESMRGFARTGSLQDLIRGTIVTLGLLANVRYFRLDTTLYIIDDVLQFFDESLFSGIAANFQRAFSLRSSETNNILILITDLQFNNERRYLELVQVFQREIYRGSYIKIFSARPQFHGTIFPQFISQERSVYIGNRPLYAICVGERSNSEFIEEVLTKAMSWENSLTLTKQTSVHWKLSFPSPNLWITGKSLVLDSRDSISFKLKIISPSILEWGDWSQYEVISEAYSFSESTFIPSSENLFIREVNSREDTIIITLFGQEIKPVPSKLWRISLRPNSVPRWIIEQSCSPDGDQARQTVRFREFIEAVIRPVTNPFNVATINIFLNKN